MIVIIDYGMGNMRSIQNKIKKFHDDVVISKETFEIENAEKLILPGVGYFSKGIENLKKYGLIDILNKKVLGDKTPILGICLGMHLFTKHSEEGDVDGLGWIDAETKKFKFNDNEKLSIPHVGWEKIKVKKNTILFNNLPDDYRYYFTHSYHVNCNVEGDVLATSVYGYEFTCAVQKYNIVGMQFHPEKSHKLAINIIKNFIEGDFF